MPAFKRVVDLAGSVIGLAVCLPLFCVIAVLIKLDSAGTVLFKQERVGRSFRPFTLWKFRTMTTQARGGRGITVGADPRITAVGTMLRRFKLDELPQLVNVLRGEMSLIGPRPELGQYVRQFEDDYRTILRVRPGMTDLASLKYRHEASMLGGQPDPERYYTTAILPDKIRLARWYVAHSSPLLDLRILFWTLTGGTALDACRAAERAQP